MFTSRHHRLDTMSSAGILREDGDYERAVVLHNHASRIMFVRPPP